ncbi:MAG: S-layer homology domain-containing protein [Firmicutes bacterium]|nr:S-layer homology domain-containing protein [Bacillota bacterium]
MKTIKRIIVTILIICTLFNIVLADTYKIIDNKKFLIRNVYEIINDGENPVYNISIKVLAGAETDSLYQKLLDIKIEPGVSYIETDDWGNSYAKIDILTLKPGGKIDITVDKIVENSGIKFDKSIYEKEADYTEFLKNILNYKYILPGKKTESDTFEIKQKAMELAKTGTTVEKAKKIYNFVNLHIDYNENPLYANRGALSGLLTGQGVCDEYSFLFTALCRASGIPSRVIAGYWVEDEISEDSFIDISEGHSWSEFYLPDVGWIPVEPTFIYTYNGERIPGDDYFANINSSDRHFINNYITNDLKKDLDVQYSYYSVEKASLVLRSKEESVKLLPKDYTIKPAIRPKDIDDNWAADYISSLYSEGIVTAKAGSLFKPNDKITRGEFAAFIVNALDLQKVKGASIFDDVSLQTPYSEHINAAAKAGLIQGFSGYYNPNKNITRQDITVIMKRAIDYLNIKKDTKNMPYYRDSKDISNYAIESIKLMYNLNIMKGRPGNIFAPKDFTSRAEASKIIWELRKLIFEK